jgi:hypothetical protein
MTAEDVIKEVELLLYKGNWQVTQGPYSWKNNQCKHYNFGYEGCETCLEDSLNSLLTDLYKKVVK